MIARAPVAAFLLCASVVSAQELTPVATVEGDYRLVDDEARGLSGFSLARAKGGAALDVTPWLRGVFIGEWTPDGKAALFDAYAQILLLDVLETRVGYSKVPMFASAFDERVELLAIPELSMAARALWPGRDLGAQAHLLASAVPLEAWVRISNGAGGVLGSDSPIPAVTARADVVLGRAHRDHADDFLGARVGGSLMVDHTFDKPGITGATAGGFAFYRAQPAYGFRNLAEGHLIFQAGPMQTSLEMGLAREERGKDTDGNPRTPRDPLPATWAFGFAWETAVMLTGQQRHAGSWPGMVDDDGDSRGRLGATEVAARLERLKLGSGAEGVVDGGAWSGALALRWWAKRWLAVGAASYAYVFDRPPLETPNSDRAWLVLVRMTASLQ